MRNLLRLFGYLGGALAVSLMVNAASVPSFTGPTGTNPLSGSQAELGDFNTLINNLNSSGATGINPNTMGSLGALRNVVENGAMAVSQRSLAAAEAIGAINGAACASANYFADRWCIDTNVASGAGYGLVAAATPTLPVGFTAEMKMYRKTGALLQPVCAIQEVSTVNSTRLAGQQATLSLWMADLGGLVTDNGGVVNLYVIYGTGSDQGLGSWTASPAITPAWTGINSGQTAAKTVTTSMVRYSMTANIPATATEIGVEICFTPTATGAGTTDGIAFTGVQLEAGATPSAYAFLPYATELATAQRYYYEIDESVSTSAFNVYAPCVMSTTSIANCFLTFPQQMRTTPTMVYVTGFAASATTASSSKTDCTALTTSATLTGTQAWTRGVLIDCASSAGFGAAGTAGFLWDRNNSGATGRINASADF